MVESTVASAAWTSKVRQKQVNARAGFMRVACVFAMHEGPLGIFLAATPIIEYADSQVFSQPPVLPYFWDESCKLDNQADEQPRMIWFVESDIVYCLHMLPLGSWNLLFCCTDWSGFPVTDLSGPLGCMWCSSLQELGCWADGVHSQCRFCGEEPFTGLLHTTTCIQWFYVSKCALISCTFHCCHWAFLHIDMILMCIRVHNRRNFMKARDLSKVEPMLNPSERSRGFCKTAYKNTWQV